MHAQDIPPAMSICLDGVQLRVLGLGRIGGDKLKKCRDRVDLMAYLRFQMGAGWGWGDVFDSAEELSLQAFVARMA